MSETRMATWPQTKTIWGICKRVANSAEHATSHEFWKERADKGLLSREHASKIISAFLRHDSNFFTGAVMVHDSSFTLDIDKWDTAKRWEPKKFVPREKIVPRDVEYAPDEDKKEEQQQQGGPPRVPKEWEPGEGDRVQLMVDDIAELENGPRQGAKGTVVYRRAEEDPGHYEYRRFGIEFDKPFTGGHDCNGRAEGGRGWYVQKSMIAPLYERDDIKIRAGMQVIAKADIDEKIAMDDTGTVVCGYDQGPILIKWDEDRPGLVGPESNEWWVLREEIDIIGQEQEGRLEHELKDQKQERQEERDDFEDQLEAIRKLHKKQIEDIKEEQKQEVFKIKTPEYIKPAIFDDVCAMVKGKAQILLVGPSGCGKSMLVTEVARVLERKLYTESFAGGKRYAQVFGSKELIDGKTEWHAAAFLKAIQEDQIVFMDEAMSCDPDVLIGMNSITDKKTRCFHTPEGKIEVHPNCVIIAAANVSGREYSLNYKGTQQQDASILNRFIHVPMDYDKKVEKKIVSEAKIKDDGYILSTLDKLRKAVKTNNISYDAGTRKLVQCIELVKLGLDVQKAFEYSFLTPLSATERKKVGV